MQYWLFVSQMCNSEVKTQILKQLKRIDSVVKMCIIIVVIVLKYASEEINFGFRGCVLKMT